MPVTAAIGGIGSIVGGIIQGHAASSAAKIQSQAAQKVADMATQAGNTAKSDVNAATGTAIGRTDAATGTAIDTVNAKTDQANSTLSNVYSDQKSNLDPYLQAGQQGVTSLASMLQPGGELTKQFAFDPSHIQDDPGYQFRLQQGQQAVERSAAAGGSLQGGGTLKAITQYGQGLASTEFGNAYDRALKTFQTNRTNTLSSLGALTGIGQTATGQFNSAAQNFGDQSSSNTFRSGQLDAQTGTQGAQFGAGLGVQGAEYGGNAGINAARIAGDALTGGANAQAAGKITAGNAYSGAVSGVGSALTLGSMLKPQAPAGGAFGGSPSGWGGYQVPGT